MVEMKPAKKADQCQAKEDTKAKQCRQTQSTNKFKTKYEITNNLLPHFKRK
jgi:hypothetical protein